MEEEKVLILQIAFLFLYETSFVENRYFDCIRGGE